MKILSSLVISAILFVSAIASALTPGAKKLVFFETQANAVAARDASKILLPHVEIPLSSLEIDFADRLDHRIRESLIIEIGGVKYVRWILNPEDTKWGKELIADYATKGINLEIKHYYHGYQTASRSYIAEDPNSKVQFSVKSSTDVTGGNWKDKKQPVGDAKDTRQVSDFLYEQHRKGRFNFIVRMDETAAIYSNNVDQAVIIRDLADLKRTDRKMFYAPGFSVLHEDMGRLIALQNGSKDPYQYWTTNYVETAARALAELAARTGIQYDSPHSQNFLVEFDANMKPTGRIVLRDFADVYITKDYINALHKNPAQFLSSFSAPENLVDKVQIGFGPLHGNHKPSWVTEAEYAKWRQVYASQFEQTFREISGLEKSQVRVTSRKSGDYFSGQVLFEAEAKKSFFERIAEKGIVRRNPSIAICRQVHLKP